MVKKIVFLLIGCILICFGAYRWGDTNWESTKLKIIESLCSEISHVMAPQIYTYGKNSRDLILEDLENVFLPFVSEFRVTTYQAVVKDELGQDTDADVNQGVVQENKTPESVPDTESSMIVSEETSVMEKKEVIHRMKLQEYDYLRQNFYQIDNTTTIGSDQLDANKLLEKDMKIKKEVNGPQILIYHTHSTEAYKDSKAGDTSMSVIGLGDYLEVLIEQKYGIEVLHHKGQYDVPSRDNAYSNALPNIEQILKENPSIEVVIDLHRDGVPETRHFVTEINGKPTAQIMFFNGLCRTTEQGDLTYLPNPYISDNLALSFQMQLAAAEYYPGFARKIYLKGYRYNMHLCPKSLLIEVGAQTNTFEEAKNAMEPLSDLLALVLLENSKE